MKKHSGYSLFLLFFSLISFHVFSGLAGCDNGGPATAEEPSTDTGAPTDTGASPSTDNPPPTDTTTPGGTPSTPPTTPPTALKNIILVVGSGMGPQQVGEVVNYRRLRKPTEAKLALERLMEKKNIGMVSTNSYLDLVSDTASANSSISCGLKARNNTIGLDANGNACETLLEKANKLGKATGLVTNAGVTSPGIAAFLTHHLNSEEQDQIAEKIFTEPFVDVLFAGGGEYLIPMSKTAPGPTPTAEPVPSASPMAMKISGRAMKDIIFIPNWPPIIPWIPEGDRKAWNSLPECTGLDAVANGYSRRSDEKDVVATAKGKGYQFLCVKDQLASLPATVEGKVLGVFSSAHFPRATDRKDAAALPTLTELTTKALEILQAKPNGFVLVLQGGLTQVAAQENDPGTLLQEGLDFDQALAKVLDFAEGRSDTLVVFTGDHETGGFGFAYNRTAGYEVDLPSGEHYDAPYNYAPYLRYDLLMEQKKSFYSLISPVLEKIYVDASPISLDEGANLLIAELSSNTKYGLDFEAAKQILYRAPGANDATTKDFSQFYVHPNIHNNLLGRAVAPQTSTVWASGTSTSTPVIVLAYGAPNYTDRLRGFLDNTELGKVLQDALLGR